MTSITRARGVERGARRIPVSSAFVWLALLAWAAFSLLPMLWLFVAITKTGTQLSTLPPFAVGSLQTIADSWSHLVAFNDGAIFNWLGNTVLLTGGQMILTVLVTIPAGYALGACDFRLRKPLLALTLAMMLIPGGALVLPLFLQMVSLGLIGTMWAVILPGAVFPLGIYLTFIYFSTTVSPDIYDAARMDGCNELQVFMRVALPLAKPILALVVFFSFVRNWGEFLLPYLMLHSDQFPLPVGLAILAAASPELNPANSATSDIGIPEVLLATVVTMLPVMVVLLISQRIVMQGASMLGGALKA